MGGVHRFLCDSQTSIASIERGSRASWLAGLGCYYEDNPKCLGRAKFLCPRTGDLLLTNPGALSMACKMISHLYPQWATLQSGHVKLLRDSLLAWLSHATLRLSRFETSRSVMRSTMISPRRVPLNLQGNGGGTSGHILCRCNTRHHRPRDVCLHLLLT